MMSKPYEKFRRKVLGSNINTMYSKITTSSNTTNARLQQETFMCLFEKSQNVAWLQPIHLTCISVI